MRHNESQENDLNDKVNWRLGKMLDGRYEMLSVLGIGGMAVVYKAFDQKLKRNVAIKVLRDDEAIDAQSRKRFRTEYQAVGMLSHPNIRAVYDVVASGDTEYIVMEYIDGINLKQYLRRKGALPWREALQFSIQIARALNHAHAKGIIHMDIKPQNIMLPRDGTAKVADFGIAQLEEGGSADAGDEAVGSIHYISPEQARGETVDARSDIYSLGVVMYEMLTGRLPFDGQTVSEVALQHFSVVPEAPGVFAPDIPPRLEEITLHAMQPDPDDRYSSAGELLADLEEVGREPADTDIFAQQADVPPEVSIRDEIHVVTRNVPRVSKVGELSRQGYVRRRARAGRISTLLGFGIVIAFALVCFSFVWNYWLEGIFRDAERLEVPGFVGQTEESVSGDEALAELFDFHVTYKADASHPAGEIIAQNPDEGTSRMVIPEGIKVDLTVSSGIKLVTLPDTVNRPSADAQVELQNLGLNVETTSLESDSVTKNHVISMEPVAGSSVSSGGTVTLFVSAGPSVTYTSVPDVVGKDKTDALLTIQRSGLVCSEAEITYVSSTEEDTGRVVWQNYVAGTQVISGEKLYIQIGSGPSA